MYGSILTPQSHSLQSLEKTIKTWELLKFVRKMLRVGYHLLILKLSKIGNSSSCEICESTLWCTVSDILVRATWDPVLWLSVCLSQGKYCVHLERECTAVAGYSVLLITILWFELRASHMLDKYFTTTPYTLPPYLFLLWSRVLLCYPGWRGAHIYIGYID